MHNNVVCITISLRDDVLILANFDIVHDKKFSPDFLRLNHLLASSSLISTKLICLSISALRTDKLSCTFPLILE